MSIFNRFDGGSLVKKELIKFIERKKLKFQGLDQKKKNLIITMIITVLIGILYLIIVLIILAATKQIGDIPWYLYIQGRYFGYTLGLSVGGFLAIYTIHSFKNRKKSYKPKLSITVYYLPFFGLLWYLLIIFALPLGPIY